MVKIIRKKCLLCYNKIASIFRALKNKRHDINIKID